MNCNNCNYEGIIDQNCPRCGIDIYGEDYEVYQGYGNLETAIEYIEAVRNELMERCPGDGVTTDLLQAQHSLQLHKERIDQA